MQYYVDNWKKSWVCTNCEQVSIKSIPTYLQYCPCCGEPTYKSFKLRVNRWIFYFKETKVFFGLFTKKERVNFKLQIKKPLNAFERISIMQKNILERTLGHE